MEELIYKNAKILVVDDVEEVLNSTKSCLKFEGMNVECIMNPIEALEYLKNNRVDVVLLDFFMPQMNGDKFINELRKFNNETIVILRTGYSDKIPPLEMLDSLNIQGYIDKLKGDDELLLMTKSAIKTSFLNKKIREKDRKIAKLNYRKAILGNLITNSVNEAKDQLMIIGGMNSSIENSTDQFKEENRVIKEAIEKIYKLYETLNFESLNEISIGEFKELLEILLKPTIIVSNATLDITTPNENEYIRNNLVNTIYSAIKLVEIMLKDNAKKIDMDIQTEEIIIKCDKNIEIDSNEIDILENKGKISSENNKIEICIG